MAEKIRKSRIDGGKLRKYRENAALSLEQLAAETEKRAAIEGQQGISVKTIWRLENGSGAQPYTISRLADALGVEPKDLLKGDEFIEGSLAECLCNFDCFIEDRIRDFVGRGFVFDAIDEFVRGNDSGYFFVRGDPGIGKSSIAAQLVKEREYIHHFNIRAEGINKAGTFIENICAQLIIDYELDYHRLPVDVSADGRFLAKLLAEISRKINDNERVIIVVDALDEVDRTTANTGANLLYLPCNLPKGIFIVATMRRQPIGMRIECKQSGLDIDAESLQNLSDINEYLKHRSASEGIQSYIRKQKLDRKSFVGQMEKKSKGNFMYLRFVLPEIESGTYTNMDFEKLPVGLENYYEDHWRRMGMMASSPPKEKIKIVYVLSEVCEPVSRRYLSVLCEEDGITVQVVLDEWKQFLHKHQVDGEDRFSIYHSSFGDFLNRKDIVKAAEITIEGINGLIADNM